MQRLLSAGLAGFILAAGSASAQSPGTMALTGPSTSHTASQVTPGAVSDAVNGQLKTKLDLNGDSSDQHVTLGATTSTLQALLSGNARLAGLLAGPTAGPRLYADYGATIERLNDRVFIGEATVSSGTYNNPVNDWVETLVPNSTDISQFAAVATIGNIGILGASRASDSVGLTNHFGVVGIAMEDSATPGDTAWALYGEAHKSAGSAGVAQAIETDIITAAGAPAGNIDPYNMSADVASINAWLSNGKPGQASGDATVALGIINNSTNPTTGGRYVKGIVFGATSILGTDGNTGDGTAIAFAKGHQINWYDSAGVGTSGISGDVSGPTAATFLDFANSGLTVTQGNGGPALLLVPPVQNAVSYPVLTAAAAGSPVNLSVGGTASDLFLSPPASFYVEVGGNDATTATAGSAALPSAPVKFKVIRDAVDGKLYDIPLYAH